MSYSNLMYKILALEETEARYLANVEDFEDRLTKAIEAKEKSLKQKQEENEALQKISEVIYLKNVK
jgi:hypothetical protein